MSMIPKARPLGYKRSVRDFVEDMVTDCRSLEWIKCVTLATRWRFYMEEVIELTKKLNKRLGK
jgi:hypothetical protein